MKKIALLLLGLIIMSCNSAEKKSEINVRVPDEEDGGEMLLGQVNKEGLNEEPYNVWFEEGFNNHLLDSALVSSLKTKLKDVKITVFMGSWCEDSQREVPALFKILEASNYNMDNLTMYAMTHDKDTPQLYEKDLNITFIPSIILYREGKELNRIVEYPQETIEKDMITILSGKDYTPYVE